MKLKINKNQLEINKGRGKITKLHYQLDRLRICNLDTQHINHKIYHLLCDPYTFVNAYSNVSKNFGAFSKGIQNEEEYIRYFSISKAENIANEFKRKKYHWYPTRRTWIPKPGKSSLRPIDMPTQKDRITQEALRVILESIYKPVFSEFELKTDFKCTNYGFRKDKSTWQAINILKIHGQQTHYAI